LQNKIERKAKNDLIKKTNLEDGMKKKKKSNYVALLLMKALYPTFCLI
jgi:hypothetical protein